MIEVIQELKRVKYLDEKYEKGYYEKDGLIIIPLKSNVSFRIQRLKELEESLKQKGYYNVRPYGNHSICFDKWYVIK